MRLGRRGGAGAASTGVQRKQLLSLGAVVSLMVALGLASALELRQVQGATSRVGTKRVPAVQLLAGVDADIRAYRELQLEHVLAKNSEAHNPIEAGLRARRAAVDSKLNRYTGFASGADERQLLTALREAWSRYVVQAEYFLAPSRKRDVDTARGYLNGVAHASFVAISEDLDAVRSANDRAVAADVQNSRETTSFGLVLTLVLIAVAAVVAIVSQIAVFIQNARTERFRSLVQRSSVLTLVCDPAGVIGYASSASVEVLGAAEDTLLGRQVVELVDEQHRDALARLLTETGSGGEARADQAAEVGKEEVGTAAVGKDEAGKDSVECQVRHADGSIRWVELTGTDLTADPAVGGIVLRLHDITARRRLECELRHAQRLESVGNLAAGIAHEINTPIQFISDNVRFLTESFAELAGLLPGITADTSDGTDGGQPPDGEVDVAFLMEEIPVALAETLEGANRVGTIVKAMKAYGYPSSEDKVPADINEAIRNTVTVATSEIKLVADVELLLADDLPPARCVVGDINQVLLNLIVNAAHAIGEVHAVTGRRGVITVRTSSDGEYLSIDVQDTGCGIPPDIADRVFDQFFTTKPVGRGTGQGLSLAHTLIQDRHGGTIGFTSTPGVGTTFTVRLPHQDAESPARQRQAS